MKTDAATLKRLYAMSLAGVNLFTFGFFVIVIEHLEFAHALVSGVSSAARQGSR